MRLSELQELAESRDALLADVRVLEKNRDSALIVDSSVAHALLDDGLTRHMIEAGIKHARAAIEIINSKFLEANIEV